MPNIAYFCAMDLRTHCTGHCSGLYGKYGIPVRGGVASPEMRTGAQTKNPPRLKHRRGSCVKRAEDKDHVGP